jgi:ATP-dependent RNA helicase DHX36
MRTTATGCLLRRLQYQPDEVMERYSHLIFDEVHEREIQVDFLLTTVRQTMRTRRSKGLANPKIILMSASIDTGLFANYFSQSDENGSSLEVACIDVPDRTFPVTKLFLGDIMPTLLQNYDTAELSTLLDGSTRSFLENEHAFAINAPSKSVQEASFLKHNSKLLDSEGVEALCPVSLIGAVTAHIVHTSQHGDVLVFLPGLMEIERTAETLEGRKPLGVDFTDKSKYKIYKLHSQLRETNDDVFEPLVGGQRKIVLATEIAETSITLPNVRYVVDSGKTR